MKEVGLEAFADCLSLLSFVCTPDVELLRSLCFRGCKSLSEFRLEAGNCLKVVKDGVFQECESVQWFVGPHGVEDYLDVVVARLQNLG